MNQNDYIGKTLKPWPILVDHYSSEFEFFVGFRDKLRKNPELVQRYNELKISCTGWSHEEYRRKKSAFIERVLGQA